MTILLERQAQVALAGIASYVDSKNTEGSGERFVKKFQKIITGFSKPNVQYAKCQNEVLASLNYSCIVFNKSIIAFSIERRFSESTTLFMGQC